MLNLLIAYLLLIFVSMEREIKVVDGWSDYQVSNHGEVWSLKFKEPKLMKPHAPLNRYLRVTFIMDGVQVTLPIHKLVWDTFSDIKIGSLYIDHIDENKLNNRFDNLQLLTNTENNRKSVIHKNGFIGCVRVPKGGLGYGVWVGKKYYGAFYTHEMAFEYLKTFPQNSHLIRDYSINIVRSTNRRPTSRKLNNDQADEMRQLSDSGISGSELTKIFGVSKYIVSNILRNKSYMVT